MENRQATLRPASRDHGYEVVNSLGLVVHRAPTPQLAAAWCRSRGLELAASEHLCTGTRPAVR